MCPQVGSLQTFCHSHSTASIADQTASGACVTQRMRIFKVPDPTPSGRHTASRVNQVSKMYTLWHSSAHNNQNAQRSIKSADSTDSRHAWTHSESGSSIQRLRMRLLLHPVADNPPGRDKFIFNTLRVLHIRHGRCLCAGAGPLYASDVYTTLSTLLSIGAAATQAQPGNWFAIACVLLVWVCARVRVCVRVCVRTTIRSKARTHAVAQRETRQPF